MNQNLPPYQSPRWSGEITDCSMPMTFDTYNNCSFRCMYCFSQNQRGIGASAQKYLNHEIHAVSIEKVVRLFTDPGKSQFAQYIKDRHVMQWGGLSDPFDDYERKHGVGLELMRFFREIDYPICFSTKGTWWTQDPRYVEVFKGAKNFNVKVSIITLDEHKAKVVEGGVASPLERMEALRRIAEFDGGGATLRLRPFIVGITTPHHGELIRLAGKAGATAVSTEFFCLERRSNSLKKKLLVMSKLAGFDITKFYKDHSYQQGYLRLSRPVKRLYVDQMVAAAKEAGMRFYISDAHFKERCDNGSCCGLPESWNYLRGQQTEAILIAKRTGRVTWADMEPHMGLLKKVPIIGAEGFNTCSSEFKALHQGLSLYDYMRNCWNDTNSGKSPYKYFEGILKPEGLDANGNVIYAYDKTKA